jgi:hypothetical protein
MIIRGHGIRCNSYLCAMTFLIELHYLPPVDVWALLSSSESTMIIEQHDHYQKGSYRNRCTIAGSQGPQALSIPLVKGKHQAMPAKEVRIVWDTPWARTHWRSIVSAYSNAPYFEHYQDSLEHLFDQKDTYLWDWNLRLFYWLKDQFRLPGQCTFTESYQPLTSPETIDLRNTLRPSTPDIRTVFSTAVPYLQVFDDRLGFLPGLSGLDLLFCSGPQSIAVLHSMRTKPGL